MGTCWESTNLSNESNVNDWWWFHSNNQMGMMGIIFTVGGMFVGIIFCWELQFTGV